MDEARRAVLRTIAVLGLAACAPVTGRDDNALRQPSTVPTPRSSPPTTPTPTPRATTPDATVPPTSVPAERVVISRARLGLPAPAAGGRPHTISGLMLHHSAAPVVPPSDAPARFRSLTRGHRDAGFVDAAYHWGVDTGGNVYELRDESIAGETFTGYDPAGWLLVVCDGNFEESEPTAAMLAAVADVFASGAGRYGIAPSTLVGHRDRAATACPGDNLQAQLPSLVAMIEERLAAGGVVLEVSDDPSLLP